MKKPKLPPIVKKILRPLLTVALIATYSVLLVVFALQVEKIRAEFEGIRAEYEYIKSEQEAFKKNFSEDLFNEHLALIETDSLETSLKVLEEKFEEFTESEEGSVLSNVDEVYELYQEYEAKVRRNQAVKLDTAEAEGDVEKWGELLLSQDFEEITKQIEEKSGKLDEQHKEYIASLPPPPSKSKGAGYQNVSTEKGTFGVRYIKLPLNEYRVKTVAANSENCKDNCPTKSLAQYVQENGAYAGMNGSYFCPPDYSSCGGKVNSYDFALYNSNRSKWMNKDALEWFKTGLITFKGNSYEFYKKSSEYGGKSVDAGISNYPSLLKNGEVVVKSGDLTSYQKDVRGARGAIGVGGENVYLAIIYNATVIDAAYAMRALGAKHALNLDGGGSTAMYVGGGYVAGPGRALPNAVLLIK
jgi:exopolysaccharide biosynthesis protein